jgi:CrcB protein
MWRNIFLVALGGALGTCSRFLVNELCSKFWKTTFPAATFIINIIGCFFMGFIIGLAYRSGLSNGLKLLLVTGFCGGFTTFSAFGQESLTLLQNNQFLIAALYTSLSVGIGIMAVWCGHQLAS